MGSYPTWVTRGDDIRQLRSRKLGASDAPAVSQKAYPPGVQDNDEAETVCIKQKRQSCWVQQ